jgi:hypothetical protein
MTTKNPREIFPADVLAEETYYLLNSDLVLQIGESKFAGNFSQAHTYDGLRFIDVALRSPLVFHCNSLEWEFDSNISLAINDFIPLSDEEIPPRWVLKIFCIKGDLTQNIDTILTGNGFVKKTDREDGIVYTNEASIFV